MRYAAWGAVLGVVLVGLAWALELRADAAARADGSLRLWGFAFYLPNVPFGALLAGGVGLLSEAAGRGPLGQALGALSIVIFLGVGPAVNCAALGYLIGLARELDSRAARRARTDAPEAK